MKSIFLPRLVNGPYDDPVLYVRIYEERGALLFDLGDITGLSPSEIMRITDVFITHTHIDHFIGFDHLLRIVLGRDKRVRFFGPPGLIEQVRGKLSGYTWNLVENYSLELEVAEFSGDGLRRNLFTCRDRFRHEEDLEGSGTDSLVLDAPLYSVRAAILDHRTPCAAYALEEKVHININKDRLLKMGLTVGPWLTSLKKLYLGGRHDKVISVPASSGEITGMRVDDLIAGIGTVRKGSKIVYVTDIEYNAENERDLVGLAAGADIFYSEAAFLDRDRDKARDKSHLTAAQAGRLAGLSGAKRLEIFHFSPRYQYEEEILRREAEEHYRAAQSEVRRPDTGPSE